MRPRHKTKSQSGLGPKVKVVLKEGGSPQDGLSSRDDEDDDDDDELVS